MNPRILLLFILCSLPAPLLAAKLELRQAGTGATEISALVGEEIEVELWVDSEKQPLSGAAVFLSFDETTFELVDQDRVPRTSGFQPFAPGAFLSNGEIYRNDLLAPEDPAAIGPGLQMDYSVVRTVEQGTGVVASFRLRARAPSHDSVVRIDENGIRETRVFLPDGSQRPFRFITPLRVAVNGISIAGLPDQLVLSRGAEHRGFRLDQLVFDPLYGPQDITWSIYPLASLSVERDPGTNTLRIVAPADASPWEQLILTATNPDGQTVADTVDIFVNAGPSLAEALASLTFAEDDRHELSLDALVDDPDTPADQLQWSATASQTLTVTIEGPPYRARLAAQPDWYGVGWAAFTVADDFGFADTAQVAITVTPVNDPPRLVAAPNVRLISGRQDSSLIVADLVADMEDPAGRLRLSWSGAAQVEVAQRGGRLVLTSRGGWTGTEEILLQVEDSDGLTDTAPLTVTVVPSLPPTLVDPPQRRGMGAGGHFVLSLDELAADPDDRDEDLTWEVSGQQQLRVQLSSARAARVEAPSTFAGIETLTFTATDPTGRSASFELLVFSAPLSGEPLISDLPEVRVPIDGVDVSLDLDDYVFDIDHEPQVMEWFVPQRDDLSVRVDPLTHVLTIAPTETTQPGPVDLRLRVYDPDGHEAVQDLRVHISGEPAGSGPSFTFDPIADIGFAPTETYAFDLDDYLTGDLDFAQIRWNVEGQDQIEVVINPVTHQVTLQANGDWTGSEQLTFVASAGDLPAQRRDVRVTVLPAGSPALPELAPLPQLSLRAGDFDQSLDLDDYVTGADPASIAWEVAGQGHVRALIDDETHLLTLTADSGWSGQEQLTLTGRDGLGNVLEGVLQVEIEAPLSDLGLRQETEVHLFAGEREIRLDLATLLSSETDFHQLAWEAEGSQALEVVYDADDEVLILRPEFPWQSSDIITLRVRDPDAGEATAQIRAQVYPADGSVGQTSPDFALAVVPNVLQPDFLDVFVLSNLPLARPPVLRLQDEIWRNLSVETRIPGIWHGSHVLRPNQEGQVEILALTIDADQQVFQSSFTLSVSAPGPNR